MPPLPSACVRFVALVVAGLCLLGADFARPDPASFALGSTTEAEIRQRFGNPYGQTTSRVGDRVVTTLQYTYAEPRTGVIPARAMTYSFYDGRLVGFDYSSSFGADETAFDEKVVKRIKRGETTRTEVLAIAGPPTGPHAFGEAWNEVQRSVEFALDIATEALEFIHRSTDEDGKQLVFGLERENDAALLGTDIQLESLAGDVAPVGKVVAENCRDVVVHRRADGARRRAAALGGHPAPHPRSPT